jgi:hypothetical protein
VPDFSGGNSASTLVPDEAVSGITGQILPEVHPPASPTPASPHGSQTVATRPPPPGRDDLEVPAQGRPGDSPDDRSTPERYPGGSPVPPDTAGGDSPRGTESFSTENDEAIGVFQRADEAWTGQTWPITGAVQIVRRMKGRGATTVYVPATDVNGNAILGVIVGPNDSDVQGNGFPLFLLPGMSMTIRSEAPVWAAPIPGNATGYVCTLTTDNPSGGQLGGL